MRRTELDSKNEAGWRALPGALWGIKILHTALAGGFFGDACMVSLVAQLRTPARLRNCQGGIPLPHVLGQQQKSCTTPNLAATSTGWRPRARCVNYPQDASLVIVVKTGATEAFSKLPTLLLAYLSCVPPENLLFFSGVVGTIGKVRPSTHLSYTYW